MLETGTEVVVQLSGEPGGPALRGMVTDSGADGCTIDIETDLLGVDADVAARIAVSYDLDGTFVRRSAEVREVERHAASMTIHLAALEEPVAAEERRIPRISMVASDASVMLEAESLCPILDIGEGGLAVMSSEEHAVGNVVKLILEQDDRRLAGRATVRSVREIFEGRYRYGLEWIEGGDAINEALKT